MPQDAASAAADTARIEALLARYRDVPGPLIELLHAVQHEFGHVPPQAVPLIARGLNLSRAEVHGVVSFYHHFRSTPAGRRTVRVCRAEACQSMAGRALVDHAERRLGVRFGETTPDGAVTLEAVYCLGLCACAPAVMIDDSVHGRVDPAALDALLGVPRSGA